MTTALKQHWPFFLCAIFGAVMILVAMSGPNPGISVDSTRYIDAARSFIANGSFGAYPYQPPGYPSLLMLSAGFGLSMVTFAGVVNVLCLVGTLFLAWSWLRQNTGSVAPLALVAITFGFPILLVHTYVWTEPPFILLVMMTLLLVSKYRSAPSFNLGILITITAGTAAMYRYSGFVLILAVAILLLSVERFRRAGAIMFVAALPALFWMISRQGASVGVGTELPVDPDVALWETGKTLIYWVLPLSWPWHVAVSPWVRFDIVGIVVVAIVGIMVVALATVLLMLILRVRPRDAVPSPVWPFIVFVALYVPFIVASNVLLNGRAGVPDTRLLSPIYIPLVFIGAYHLGRMRKGLTSAIVMSALAVLLIMGVVRSGSQIQLAHNGGYASSTATAR